MHPGCYSLPANWSEAYRPRIKSSASWIRKVNILKICLRLVQPTAHRLPLPYHNRRRDRWLPFLNLLVLYLVARSLQDSQIERNMQRHHTFLFRRSECTDSLGNCLNSVIIQTYDQLTKGSLSQSFVSQKNLFHISQFI